MTTLPDELLTIILTIAASASVNDARRRGTWERLRCVCKRAKELADAQAVTLLDNLVLRLKAYGIEDRTRLADFCSTRGINLQHMVRGSLWAESSEADKIRCGPCGKLFKSFEFGLKHWCVKHMAPSHDVTSYLKMQLSTLQQEVSVATTGNAATTTSDASTSGSGPGSAFKIMLLAYADYDKATALRHARKLRKTIVAPSEYDNRKPAKPKEIQRRFTTLAKAEGGVGTSMEIPDLPIALRSAAQSLDVGAVSPEVETQQGVYLFMRTA